MTPRERWLAAVRMQPVDRIPFWPKLDAGYPRAHPPPFRDMDLDALHAWIGSDPHLPVGGCTREVRTRTSVETVREGAVQRTIYRTRHGDMVLEQAYDAPSNAWHPVRFPVRDAESVRWMTGIYEDVAVEFDEVARERSRERDRAIGQRAVTACSIGESPLMHWVEYLAGIENAHLLLADHPGEVEALFAAMQRVLARTAAILCDHSPADLLYLVENTSTTLISPAQYRRYCAVHVGECARLAAQAGRNLVLHMCGHLKALLPDLARLPVRAFEAFTAPPLGDATLLDGRAACPETCLIGGTHAMLWLRPAGAIAAAIAASLDALPHHRGVVVTSAGVMPPRCPPETIRSVREWLACYPARMG